MGQVWTWGKGSSGFLGHKSTKDELLPRAVTSLSIDIENIAAGDEHVIVVGGT